MQGKGEGMKQDKKKCSHFYDIILCVSSVQPPVLASPAR